MSAGDWVCGLPPHKHTTLYLEVEGLDGLPILVVGKCAKKCPFLLQVFIEALQKSIQGGVREGHLTLPAMLKGQVSPLSLTNALTPHCQSHLV